MSNKMKIAYDGLIYIDQYDGFRTWRMEAEDAVTVFRSATEVTTFEYTDVPNLEFKDWEKKLVKAQLQTQAQVENQWQKWYQIAWNAAADSLKGLPAVTSIPDDPESKRRAGTVIRQAVDLLRKYGWQQGTMGNSAVGYCALGAIGVATGQMQGSLAVMLFLDWLKQYFDNIHSIPQWNDDPHRTKDEIISYMTKFADECAPLPPADLDKAV